MNVRNRIINGFISNIDDEEGIPKITIKLIKKCWEESGTPTKEIIREAIEKGIENDSKNKNDSH